MTFMLPLWSHFNVKPVKRVENFKVHTSFVKITNSKCKDDSQLEISL